MNGQRRNQRLSRWAWRLAISLVALVSLAASATQSVEERGLAIASERIGAHAATVTTVRS